MQAPKDAPDAPTPKPPLGEIPARFATRNSPEARAKRACDDAFARGMREGLDPLAFDQVAVGYPTNNDVVTYSIGGVSVHVSGLELLQAEDPEALGFQKGLDLYRLYGEANPPLDTRQGVVRTALQDRLEQRGQERQNSPMQGEPCVLVTMQRLSTVLHEMAGRIGPGSTDEDVLKVVAQTLETLSHEPQQAPRKPAQSEEDMT